MSNAFICDFVRTPIGRYDGGLARVRTDDLAAHAIRSLIAKAPPLADAIDEVFLGCANQAGEDNRNVARMATLLAGLPDRVPGITVNRLCASGLDAVAAAARALKAGEIELAIAGGVESMTRAPFVMGKAEKAFQRTRDMFDSTIGWRFMNARMIESYGTDSMPETGENVAADYRVAREDQDAFALRSHQRRQSTGRRFLCKAHRTSFLFRARRVLSPRCSIGTSRSAPTPRWTTYLRSSPWSEQAAL